MKNATKKTVKYSHTIKGDWHKTTAPNGSCSCVERTLHTVTIYTADYYGKGSRLYAHGVKSIETDSGNGQTSIGPLFGSWDDGNQDAVSAWVKRIGLDMCGL